MHPSTLRENVRPPRYIYLQLQSYTEYKRAIALFAEAAHDDVLTAPQERSLQRFVTRVHCSFLSAAFVLEHSRSVLATQQDANHRLEARIQHLEHIVQSLLPSGTAAQLPPMDAAHGP